MDRTPRWGAGTTPVGPAPMRPYNEVVHPRGWRAFMEYSNGIVGDMCIHMFDMVRWMMGLGSMPYRDSGIDGTDGVFDTPFAVSVFSQAWPTTYWLAQRSLAGALPTFADSHIGNSSQGASHYQADLRRG